MSRPRTSSLALLAVFGLGLSSAGLGALPAAQAAPATADAAATGSAGLLTPYYTEGDLTGDDQITEDDLDLLVAALGSAVRTRAGTPSPPRTTTRTAASP
ncbi:hypothetical protein [Nocardioides sambongensis]|uniref:hypothetical protein n=1 Tax=Nocardioides sambongensis TaxID=2589074 RepID=UPI0018C8B79E|nr:hypothetical protein [Nocardioides sambongensis]